MGATGISVVVHEKRRGSTRLIRGIIVVPRARCRLIVVSTKFKSLSSPRPVFVVNGHGCVLYKFLVAPNACLCPLTAARLALPLR